MRAIVVWLTVLLGCAPTIDGPIERQRAADEADARQLEHQLAALPHALGATVTLHRSIVDPFTLAHTPGGAALLVVVDSRADRTAIVQRANELVRGVAPDVAAPSIVVDVDVGAPPAGARSRPTAALAALLAAITVLAGSVAWRERWRVLT